MSSPSGSERPYFTPSSRVEGDWSAHIATTIDRTASLLEQLTAEQWQAPSLCSGWRVQDVAGHLVWRLGEPGGRLLRSASTAVLSGRRSPAGAVDALARDYAQVPPQQLVARLREIAAAKLYGKGRAGISELTEAVVHAYDIAEALGIPLSLSPRSTSAVAIARIRVPFSHAARLAAGRTLLATDARWRIGRGGTKVEGTAGRLLAALFGRLPLPE